MRLMNYLQSISDMLRNLFRRQRELEFAQSVLETALENNMRRIEYCEGEIGYAMEIIQHLLPIARRAAVTIHDSEVVAAAAEWIGEIPE